MSVSPDVEGLIQFELKRVKTRRKVFNEAPHALRLVKWRQLLVKIGWMGQDPKRYDGLGFGNLSIRIGAKLLPPEHRSFLISGSQTGHLKHFSSMDCAVVTDFSLKTHALSYFGERKPSSEALSHAAIYAAQPSVNVCIHAHCPTIWQRRETVSDLCIASQSKYGTADMSRSIYTSLQMKNIDKPALLSMSGHRDGVMAFGKDFETTFNRLTKAYLNAVA